MVGFIKALHKGLYAYDMGQPGGLNIMSIPHTLNGSGQENCIINQVLAAESNKDDPSLKKKEDTEFFYNLSAKNSKLRNQNTRRLHSSSNIGRRQKLHTPVSGRHHRMGKKNEQILSDNTTNFDKSLPTKLVYRIGYAYNSYYKMAKYAVPNQAWLSLKTSK